MRRRTPLNLVGAVAMRTAAGDPDRFAAHEPGGGVVDGARSRHRSAIEPLVGDGANARYFGAVQNVEAGEATAVLQRRPVVAYPVRFAPIGSRPAGKSHAKPQRHGLRADRDRRVTFARRRRARLADGGPVEHRAGLGFAFSRLAWRALSSSRRITRLYRVRRRLHSRHHGVVDWSRPARRRASP